MTTESSPSMPPDRSLDGGDAVAATAVGSAADPWRSVLELGRRQTRGALVICIVAGMFAHVTLASEGYRLGELSSLRAFSASVSHNIRERLKVTFKVELEKEPPPPVPEPEKAEPAPEPAPVPPPVKAAPAPDPLTPPPPPPPAPPAAEAGKVLTAEPDPDEPLDLTGDVGFVTGTGDRYVGGVTATGGTGKKAVYDRGAQAGGVEGAKGKAPDGEAQYSGPDLSRKAGLVGGQFPNPPFPPEADVAQINTAQVTLAITVDGNGKAIDVRVLKDPGYGFGEVARRAALRTAYNAALSRSGKPLTTTLTLNVSFRR
jgi:periplasmic protein TonB